MDVLNATLKLLLLLALIYPAPFGAGQRDPQPVYEQDVEAAFLYNFTKYVEWPALPADPGAPFRLCVVADADFVKAVERIIDGELVQGRRLARIEPRSADEARACQILYVGRSAVERGSRLLPALRQAPVLTVSDAPNFIAHGGTIQFVVEGGRVRFDVSTAAAEQAGLTVSSKLLRVARHVEGRQP